MITVNHSHKVVTMNFTPQTIYNNRFSMNKPLSQTATKTNTSVGVNSINGVL
jgi:hypothetical protein